MNTVTSVGTTTLYSLVPMGLGTGQIESLKSYIHRLALAHCVSVNRLLTGVIAVAAGEVNKISPWIVFSSNVENFLGLRSSVRLLCRVLETLTGRDDMKNMTMLPYGEHINGEGLFHGHTRYCRECFRTDLLNGVLPHERLLWTLRAVDACPLHGVILDESAQCGNLKAVPCNSLRRTGVGFCKTCGSLGMDCDASPMRVATKAQISMSCSLAEMLATSNVYERPSFFGPREAIQEAIHSSSRGVRGFMEDTGVARGRIYRWLLTPRGRLSLVVFCNIALAHGVSLSLLMRGEWCKVNDPLPIGPVPTRRLKEDSRLALAAGLREGISSGLSLASVAKQLGATSSTLKFYEPELVTTLVAAKVAQERDRYLCELARAENMALQLWESGERLTTRNARRLDPVFGCAKRLAYVAFGRFRRIIDPSLRPIGRRKVPQVAVQALDAIELRLKQRCW